MTGPPIASRRCDVGPGIVTVVAARLSRPPASWDTLAGDTTPAERARAARFVHADDAHRHLLGRALARRCLAPILGCAPAVVPIVTDAHGKPGLPSGRPVFNLSHSGDWVLCALAAEGRLGVDVEAIRPIAERDAILADILTAEERRQWKALPEAGRDAAFHAIWARKEAWLKALGVGLARVADLAVRVGPDEVLDPARRGITDDVRDNVALGIAVPGERLEHWVVRPVRGIAGAAAAVAWDHPMRRLDLYLAPPASRAADAAPADHPPPSSP